VWSPTAVCARNADRLGCTAGTGSGVLEAVAARVTCFACLLC
jgi:hypothetical protein